jgi:hypothetical protein
MRPLERPRRRWADNFKLDPRKVEWSSVIWIALAQDRNRQMALVNTVMNFRVHKMLWYSWLAERLLASQEGLSYLECWVWNFTEIDWEKWIISVFLHSFALRYEGVNWNNLKMGEHSIKLRSQDLRNIVSRHKHRKNTRVVTYIMFTKIWIE